MTYIQQVTLLLSTAGGRYLNDIWALHLGTLAWEVISTSAKPDSTEIEPVGGEAEAEPLLPGNGFKDLA